MPNSHINRYIVECKASLEVDSNQRNDYINRYIVECKAFYAGCFIASLLNINRYIVECKESFMDSHIRYRRILIDT